MRDHQAMPPHRGLEQAQKGGPVLLQPLDQGRRLDICDMLCDVQHKVEQAARVFSHCSEHACAWCYITQPQTCWTSQEHHMAGCAVALAASLYSCETVVALLARAMYIRVAMQCHALTHRLCTACMHQPLALWRQR